MAKKIGILGSGPVGQVLALGFSEKGYDVMIGSRTPSKLEDWKREKGHYVSLGTFAEAASFGEIIVLAVKATGAIDALKISGPAKLADKTVIDATNPISDAPPVDGVISFFTTYGESFMERLQNAVPGAMFVKAFNSVGSGFMVNPDLPGGPPTMFICGNSDKAKSEVKAILKDFGWDVADMGSAPAARAIEPLCMLWCIPGMRENDWSHAFKLLRK
jgi:8-hydroxy-5-deazaflavin:NADPH oxidoreductase